MAMQQMALKPGNVTILIADDDSVLLGLNKEILEGNGYRVITASHGMDAIKQYEHYRHEISLAIFDVVMPYMNGPDAAIYIAALDPDLPFIFVSGYDQHESLQHLSIPQGFRVLPKPVDFDVFSSVIEDVLGA